MSQDARPAPAPATSPPPAPAPPSAKPMRFPTALTVLVIILAVVWVASFFIPSGVYQLDRATGRPIPGSYSQLPACDAAGRTTPCVDKSFRSQFLVMWTATPYGLYGIEGPTGRGSADASGFLYGSAQIFLF